MTVILHTKTDHHYIIDDVEEFRSVPDLWKDLRWKITTGSGSGRQTMRLIDADELLKRVDQSWQNAGLHGVDYYKFKKWVHSMPTIEAEPTKRGRWLIGVGENGEPIGTYCSECGWSWECNIAAIQLNKVLSRIETPRCPYCGARMDGGEDE